MPWRTCHPTRVNHIISATVRLLAQTRRFISLALYLIVWNNFEIADMNFWRGEAYTQFFEYLDSHGGFYYEV